MFQPMDSINCATIEFGPDQIIQECTLLHDCGTTGVWGSNRQNTFKVECPAYLNEGEYSPDDKDESANKEEDSAKMISGLGISLILIAMPIF